MIYFYLEAIMKPHKEVKKAMIDLDFTIVRLAKMTGYSVPHTSNVINGHFKAPKARQAIADALGKDVHVLFGADSNNLNDSSVRL